MDYWPRFRTMEDAQRAVDAFQKGQRMPPELYIPPFKLVGTLCVRNQEYEDAQYEFRPIFEK